MTETEKLYEELKEKLIQEQDEAMKEIFDVEEIEKTWFPETEEYSSGCVLVRNDDGSKYIKWEDESDGSQIPPEYYDGYLGDGVYE